MDEVGDQERAMLLLPPGPRVAGLLPAPPVRVEVGAEGKEAARVRRVRWVVGIAGCVLALAGGGTLLALAMAQSAPGWWREIDPKSPAVREAAQRVENGAAT
ncbi:MAG TPA: hypothetical protein VHC70_07860, partial [Phycisphaerales bacterium]|nr:hypothetical protein [Phycisphaerales bacterium]